MLHLREERGRSFSPAAQGAHATTAPGQVPAPGDQAEDAAGLRWQPTNPAGTVGLCPPIISAQGTVLCCLPAPAPPGLWQPSQHLATLAPVAAAAPAPSTRPEAPSTPAPAGSHAPCSPCCPRLPAQVGRLWPTLPPAGRGPGGPGPSPSCLLGPPAGLALGPALWAALRGTCGPEPCGPNPTCHCHCHPSPHRDPRPHPHLQTGPRLCTLLPTQAPAAGGQPWLHRPRCQQ